MAASAPSAKLQPSAPTRHLRVLYADDLPELRDIVRLTLSRDGHGVECFADGQLALHRVTADPKFDLVITDHHMPNLNGLELVRGLKRIGYRGRLMVFSSELSNEIAAEYRQVGVDRILYKPVYPSVMREMIHQMFG